MERGRVVVKVLHFTFLSSALIAFVFGATMFYRYFITGEAIFGVMSLASWLIGGFSALIESVLRKLFEAEHEHHIGSKSLNQRGNSKVNLAAAKSSLKVKPKKKERVRMAKAARKAKRYPLHHHIMAMVAAIEKRGEDVDYDVDVENVSRSGVLVKSDHHFAHNVIVTLEGKRIGGSVVRELYAGRGHTYYYGIKYQDEQSGEFVRDLLT